MRIVKHSTKVVVAGRGRRPIETAEHGRDYEIDVGWDQLGVQVVVVNDSGERSRVPHISSDQARELAARLVYAADRIDTM